MIQGGRFSIGILMAVVFLIAADFGIVRATWGDVPLTAIEILTLPTINVLLLLLTKLRRDRESRRFWVGFEWVGWGMVGLVALLTGWIPQKFLSPIRWTLQVAGLENNIPAQDALMISCAVVIYTTPQLAAATLGGWLLSRYRVVIERRPGPEGSP